MKLNTRITGNGPPLIILHGLFGMSDNWISVARMLENDFTVILPDLRNHGYSVHTKEMSIEAMAADIVELIGSLGHEKVNLAGHSLGGKVAMQVAASYPALLNALVVVDIGPQYYPVSPLHKQVISVLRSVDLKKVTSRKEVEQQLVASGMGSDVVGLMMKNLTRSETAFAWKMNLEVIENDLEKVSAAVIPGDHPVSIPVLFIGGSKSQYIGKEAIIMAKQLFLQVDHAIIDGAGHWVHADKPDAFVACIREFLLPLQPLIKKSNG